MRGLIATAVDRRVTVGMASLATLIFGLLALSSLPISLLPNLSFPTLTVRTVYTGAAPQEIENLITRPIEEALGVVKGLREIESVSMSGQSDVTLSFDWGADMDAAAIDVREKLDPLELPLQSDRPLLLRLNPDTDPILRLSLAQAEGASISLEVLRRYADDNLRKVLEPVIGVAAVKIAGGLEDMVQVDVDQSRLAGIGLTVDDLAQRLDAANVNLSSGRIADGRQRFLVRTVNEFRSIEDIGNTIVASSNGATVRLRDVASVRLGAAEREAIIRQRGNEAVEIAIYREGDANVVTVADAVRKALASQEEALPETMVLTEVDDQSLFIRQSISDVVTAAVIGGLLAVLVIFCFLREAWATAVIAVTIPLSVVATFFAMSQAGISLNIMSLGGLALAVGLLVDNGIVVLENMNRRRQAVDSVVDAAINGTQEVSGAIVASTLTTLAVFVPLVFVHGLAGELFADQSLTVAFALLISLIVALTVVPMIYGLRAPGRRSFANEVIETTPRRGFFAAIGRLIATAISSVASVLVAIVKTIFGLVARLFGLLLTPLVWLTQRAQSALLRSYQKILPGALQRPGLVLGTAALLAVLAGWQATQLGAQLLPDVAQGRLIVELELPPGTPLVETDRALYQLANALAEDEQVESVFAVAGSGSRLDANPGETGENTGRLLVALSNSAAALEARVSNRLRNAARSLPGGSVTIERPALFSFSTPLELRIVGFDLVTLRRLSETVADQLSADSQFVDVKSSLAFGHPEVQIAFDEDRIARANMDLRAVADQAVGKLRGQVATRYQFQDRRIDVLVRAAEDQRNSLEDVRTLSIETPTGGNLPLAALADIRIETGPASIRRANQERVATVSANLAYGDLASATSRVQAMLDAIEFPRGFSYEFAGQQVEMEAATRSLALALGLAIFLVYLVMASQFESLRQPFAILLTVPLAGVGSVAALTLTGTPWSAVALIGLIMLAGIVVNNAIVLIDRINQQRASGLSCDNAILEAASSRLRPIIMTTLTTTLGLLPLALGWGDGAALRAPLAITVIGGLLGATALTLLVVPVSYRLLENDRAPSKGLSSAVEQPA